MDRSSPTRHGREGPPNRSPSPSVAEPPVRVVETHISMLFLYGDRVVKVRKPVDYGFVDFTTRERRRADCERELALNRRLAPDVYIGLGTFDVDDRPVEHGVVMRRLPADRNLGHLLGTGATIDEELHRIVQVLAAFHETADRSAAISSSATATALWQRWQQTEEELDRFIGSVLDRPAYREMTVLASKYLRGRSPLFEERITAGQVCDGHGDLQAADVFCLDDGPRILDCLEFDDQLRHGDVLGDVAFLAADLEHRGAPREATVLLREYERYSGRQFPPSLEHFYTAARAHVRMLVECLQLEQGIPGDPTGPGRLLEQGLGHLRAGKVRLVMVAGLPGSGKSTLAEWLGRQLGAEWVSTDHLRILGRGGPDYSTSGSGASHYDEASRAAVYEAMCQRAAALLGQGQSVVLDGTWTSAAMRQRAAAVAHDTTSELVELWCDCPTGIRNRRISERGQSELGESDADVTVATLMAQNADPWPSAQSIDSSGSIDEAGQAALGAVGATEPPIVAGP